MALVKWCGGFVLLLSAHPMQLGLNDGHHYASSTQWWADGYSECGACSDVRLERLVILIILRLTSSD